MSNKERKALGRGLQALFEPTDNALFESSPIQFEDIESNGPNLLDIKIAKISLNPKQPRIVFNPEKLQELSQSIQVKGIIQPILVREKEEKGEYELVTGERRLRATTLAGFDSILAIVKDVSEKELLEITLIENIQRQDLNPIEEAVAYQNLLQEHSYTQENLAKRVGKNRSTITNLLRLLNLPEVLKSDVSEGRLSSGHARAVLSLDNDFEKERLAKKVIEEDLSVRETEKLVKIWKNNDSSLSSKVKKSQLSAQMKLNQERISDVMMIKTKIKGNAQKGKIELEYFTEDEFNTLFTKLIKKDSE